MSAHPLSPQGEFFRIQSLSSVPYTVLGPSTRSWADQVQSPFAQTPQSAFPQMPPQSAGAYGRGQGPIQNFPPQAHGYGHQGYSNGYSGGGFQQH